MTPCLLVFIEIPEVPCDSFFSGRA